MSDQMITLRSTSAAAARSVGGILTAGAVILLAPLPLLMWEHWSAYELVGILVLALIAGLLVTFWNTRLVADQSKQTVTRWTGALLPFWRVTHRWADFTEIVLLKETTETESGTQELTILRLTGPQHTLSWNATYAEGSPRYAAQTLAEFTGLPLRDET